MLQLKRKGICKLSGNAKLTEDLFTKYLQYTTLSKTFVVCNEYIIYIKFIILILPIVTNILCSLLFSYQNFELNFGG